MDKPGTKQFISYLRNEIRSQEVKTSAVKISVPVDVFVAAQSALAQLDEARKNYERNHLSTVFEKMQSQRGQFGARDYVIQALGIGQLSDVSEIRRRYRHFAKMHHPDRAPSDQVELATELLQIASELVAKIK